MNLFHTSESFRKIHIIEKVLLSISLIFVFARTVEIRVFSPWF